MQHSFTFLKYLRNWDTQLLLLTKKEKVDILIKVYLLLLLDKVLVFKILKFYHLTSIFVIFLKFTSNLLTLAKRLLL